MKIIWETTIVENGSSTCATYDSLRDAEISAIRTIVEKIPDIKDVIDEVLKERHTEIATKMIETVKKYFYDYESYTYTAFSDLFDEYYDAFGIENRIKEGLFSAEAEASIYCLDFARKLHIESNLWDPMTYSELSEGYISQYASKVYIYAKLGTVETEITIDAYEESEVVLPRGMNAILVHRVLTEATSPLTRKEICDKIFAKTGVDLSVAAISDQIGSLRTLGYPISVTRANKYTRGDTYEEGYSISGDVNIKSDCSECKKGAYPLLLLLFFQKHTGDFFTEDAIIQALFDHYSIKVRRATLSSHIKLLLELGYGIEYAENEGYRFVERKQ